MKTGLRMFAVLVIYALTSIAWVVLGGVMSSRASGQSGELRARVAELWGQPQTQQAPSIGFEWTTTREETRRELVGGAEKQIRTTVIDKHHKQVPVASTRADVDLHLDPRLKGLVWYALYDVRFHGAWTYVHGEAQSGSLRVRFQFPDPNGVFDDVRFEVDGKPQPLSPEGGAIEALVPVTPGQAVSIAIGYRSRGMDAWRYVPSNGVGHLADFELRMKTDFTEIDFPATTMSPSSKERDGGGYALVWRFADLITGNGIGMEMPRRLQPGELAASLSFSAPVSLLFYFLVVAVLSRLRGLDVHPVNYLFLGAGFFSFHILFAYTVDHLSIVAAFALSSAVSVTLVATYLRLVVSTRFALVEAALAQLVYLVGFSLAHFWEGFTGLTITALSILTLFLLMQLTGRIRWSGPNPTRVPAPVPA